MYSANGVSAGGESTRVAAVMTHRVGSGREQAGIKEQHNKASNAEQVRFMRKAICFRQNYAFSGEIPNFVRKLANTVWKINVWKRRLACWR